MEQSLFSDSLNYPLVVSYYIYSKFSDEELLDVKVAFEMLIKLSDLEDKVHNVAQKPATPKAWKSFKASTDYRFAYGPSARGGQSSSRSTTGKY